MKKIYTIILIIVSAFSFSQNYVKYNNRWRLGLNMGGTWQTSDINSYAGIAGGGTLEKGFCENETNFFSFSLRGRVLSGRTFGIHYNRNYNVKDNEAYNGKYDPKVNYFDSVAPSRRYVYENYRTPYTEGALEFQLDRKSTRLNSSH